MSASSSSSTHETALPRSISNIIRFENATPARIVQLSHVSSAWQLTCHKYLDTGYWERVALAHDHTCEPVLVPKNLLHSMQWLFNNLRDFGVPIIIREARERAHRIQAALKHAQDVWKTREEQEARYQEYDNLYRDDGTDLVLLDCYAACRDFRIDVDDDPVLKSALMRSLDCDCHEHSRWNEQEAFAETLRQFEEIRATNSASPSAWLWLNTLYAAGRRDDGLPTSVLDRRFTTRELAREAVLAPDCNFGIAWYELAEQVLDTDEPVEVNGVVFDEIKCLTACIEFGGAPRAWTALGKAMWEADMKTVKINNVAFEYCPNTDEFSAIE